MTEGTTTEYTLASSLLSSSTAMISLRDGNKSGTFLRKYFSVNSKTARDASHCNARRSTKRKFRTY